MLFQSLVASLFPRQGPEDLPSLLREFLLTPVRPNALLVEMPTGSESDIFQSLSAYLTRS